MTEHPAPWWYRLAERIMPGRCREIPEAQNPNRIVLRQVAIIKRYLYLQGFAGSEDWGWFHTHQWRQVFGLGLCGGYYEERPGGKVRERQAPYFFTMDHTGAHRVYHPTKGHTALFLGWRRDDNLKRYIKRSVDRTPEQHIKKWVKRI